MNLAEIKVHNLIIRPVCAKAQADFCAYIFKAHFHTMSVKFMQMFSTRSSDSVVDSILGCKMDLLLLRIFGALN